MKKKTTFILFLLIMIGGFLLLGQAADIKIDRPTFRAAVTQEWSEPVNVSMSGSPSYDPKVAVDGEGNVHVIWVEEDGGERVFYNTNLSGQWGTPQNVTKNEVRIGEGPWPEIEVDNNGVPCVLYSAVTGGNYEAVLNRYINGAWTGHWNVAKTSNGGSAYPCIVIDRNTNDYYVFWQDDANRAFEEQTYWEIWMRYLKGGSGSWIGGGILPDRQHRAYTPQAAIDSQGGIYVIYANRALGNLTRVFFTQNKEPKDWNKWTDSIDISGSTGLSFAYPQVACDNAGNVYVVWMDNREGNIEVYFRKRVKNKWSSIINLSNSAGPSEDPTVAVNKETGDIYVAWEESQKIFFREFKDGKWLDPVNLTEYSSSSAHPHLYVDQGGSIHLVFTDNRTGVWNIFYRYRLGKPLREPSPPANLSLSTSLDEATSTKNNQLTWEANEENTGLDIQNYRIYRQEESGGSFQLIATVDGETFTYHDQGLPTNMKYKYAVSAIDKWEQESGLSVAVGEERIFAPLSPSLETYINRVLFYREKIIRFSWRHNPLNDPLNLSHYNIYRKEASAGDSAFELIATVDAGNLNYSDRGLSFNQKYAYAVTVVDAEGNESPRSPTVKED
ncbi:hypothetical protein NLC35_03825 [Candidatus Aminicenantes bacterium AC-334-K16]|nr:hypothetical protein [Candidatus Aminicenantes bacterium AC-334-K16]